MPRSAPAVTQTVRCAIGLPEKGRFAGKTDFLSVSPDGSKLAFVASNSSGGLQLWIRALDSTTVQASGTGEPV
jgi:Tol biopolymer transport system component